MRIKEIHGIGRSKLVGIFVLTVSLILISHGQTIVDKTVATVSDGTRTELITYSDLKWQLALQPGMELTPARSEDLNLALTTVINQRIFSLEAERIPRSAPTDKEIQDEIKETLAAFTSTAEFERRLRIVGFESVKDENFEQLIAKRVAIKKYIDFRFRSFVVNTAEEETQFYNQTYVPDFRRRFPGVVTPTLEEKRQEIDRQLTESKVLANIEAFLDDAKRRIDVVVLKPV
ncbi:MAG: hypothetical protein HOP17_02000 [Acidobacteria bacterium]|nr:hypothetical protein [Acidobacteriota bacterium]